MDTSSTGAVLSSLYAQYLKERESKEILEDETGFATYTFVQDGVYIENIYTHPDYRQSGVASKFADKIAEIAKAKGYKKMYGSVVPTANNSTASLKVLLAYGFRLDSAQPNAIFMIKDIP